MFVKKAIFTVVLALMAFSGLQAQSIRKNDRFTDGYREWTVEEVRMGIYVYMIDGQGDEITLEAVKGES